MISKSKKLFLKFILASFLISAVAVTLGFFGTHIILNSQERRIENHFVPEALRTIELIHKKTGMPLAEVVEEYNNFSRTSVSNDEGHGPRRPPMNITVVSKTNTSFILPNKIGTFSEIKGPVTDFKMFNDQVYNYDGTNFLVFKFNSQRPPGEVNMKRGDGQANKPLLPMFILPLILTFVIILFVITAASLLVLYFLRRQAKKAGEVLQALKHGNLKARFPITKIDEASELMLEFNQMAQEIEKLVVDLRDVDNLRRKLLQELAHDLRTPISSMKSLLESLLFQGHKMSEDLRKENLELTIKEVDYFHQLVEDLLFLSGVHDLKYGGKSIAIDVTEVVQHEVQVLIEANKNLNINMIADDFYFVKADPLLFQRLMKNALSNAVNNAQSNVMVKLSYKENQVLITISNDGQGLSQEDIATFGKKRATRRVYENIEGRISIGLGAVIMAKICEIHSAKMIIKNLDEDGTTGVKLEFHFINSTAGIL
jgi:signal transduction histidine kinase